MSFFERIETRAKAINSLLCIGLDPHSSELNCCPTSATEVDRAEAAYHFCVRIIDATHPHAVCYKPNAAFFEALGHTYGMATLRRVIDHIIPHDVPVLLDVKRGDIGTTAEAYAYACYEKNDGCGADGATLSPLMGWDSIQPFITGKCFEIYILYVSLSPMIIDIYLLLLI
jgi:orotidine 5'-phosphate decarboxylase subfamily 2